MSDYGVTRADFPILAQKAAAASSMKANPIVLTPEELGEVLARRYRVTRRLRKISSVMPGTT